MDGNVIGAATIGHDITKCKSLEEQCRQAQRMEAIGRLASGVAHDFNNLLTVINGCSDFLLRKRPANDPETEIIQEINKSGWCAAALTRQLLAFSRKHIIEPRLLDLNAEVNELVKMLQRLIGEDIDLVISLDPAPAYVEADPGQLEQVIMNLAVNARDAMPAGGSLTIQTSNVELEEVLLTISDTGCGMDKATLARISELFFTTKGMGKGTGLGLATVYGIIKQAGGHVEVASELKRGTTFKIYLPRSKPAASAMLPGQDWDASVCKTARGSETILLTEDEDGVRALARVILEASGYQVLGARDGQEALQIAQGHAGPIHLLLTDVVMPQMDGPQLADSLTTQRPDVKVLYFSGYTDDTLLRHGVQNTSAAFFPKPFSHAVLTRKVREVLDGDISSSATGGGGRVACPCPHGHVVQPCL